MSKIANNKMTIKNIKKLYLINSLSSQVGERASVEMQGTGGEMRGARGAEVTDQLGGGHIDSPACLIGASYSPLTVHTPPHSALGLIDENNFYDFNSNSNADQM